MSRLQSGKLLDFQAAAFQVVSGNASGVTPISSGWIRVDNVESIDVTLVTAASTNVAWSVLTATNAQGSGAAAYAAPPLLAAPVFPTGVNQNASVNIPIPENATYLQLTATPSAGSGAITATPTMVTGKPAVVSHVKDTGVVFDCPASATLAGQAYLDYSANYNPGNRDLGIGALPKNSIDPAIFFPATDVTDTAYTVPVLVASTGQTLPLRLGRLEFIALRARFAPSAGFGRYKVTYNSKA